MTRRILFIAGVAFALLASYLVTSDSVQATPQMGETMDLACTVCHDKPGSKLMTDEGKFYEAMGTLEGYEEVVAMFGECTTCHQNKPGSMKLTPNGRRFRRLVGDMDGLEEYVDSHHPFPPADGEQVQSEEIDGSSG